MKVPHQQMAILFRRHAGEHSGDDLRPALMCVGFTALSLSFITVMARFYSRYTLSKVAADDWFILGAWFGLAIIIRVHHHAVMHGEIGLRSEEVHAHDYIPTDSDPNHTTKDRIFVLFAVITYHFTTTWIRVSVLLFLDRINPAYNFLRRLVFAAITINILFFIGISAAVLGTCVPIPLSMWSPGWKAEKGAGRCLVTRQFSQGLPFFLDLLVWAMPLAVVHKVRRRARQKIQLAIVLCLGFGAVIACAVRIPFTAKAIRSDDPGWNHAKSQILVDIEVCFGIVAASAPAMSALFAFTTERIRRISSRQNDSENDIELGDNFRANSPRDHISRRGSVPYGGIQGKGELELLEDSR